MFAIKSITVLFFVIIPVSHCQRRIKDGEEVTIDRKYVVYLVKAPMSDVGYDSWLCGGAIVSSEFVVTSAACVLDVDYLFVIAGYRNYIADMEIETDKCTSTMKKKAIYTCSPKGYELKYAEIDYWSYIDIALVKVDSPFDFDDPSYETLCSYKPTSIAINYEEKYQEPGTDAMVLGWGHTTNWRVPGDLKNYNQDKLRYAPTLLLNKTTCIEHYEDYKNMSRVINTYMICSLGKGNIDDSGNTIQQNIPLQNGCTSQQQKLLGFEGISCEQESTEESYDDDETRRNIQRPNKTNNISLSDFNETQARRNGICQNDHGGPLVTWAGAREILIGVASVFKVSDKYECMGPYLYTSTLCTGLFLDCLLNSEFPSRRRDLCDKPASERGYDLIERTISWKDYPTGPAKNKNIERMPKAKISEGLKYLTNNNQPIYAENVMNVENVKTQEETKYESINSNLANKNPAIINNAPIERFKIKGTEPENKSVSGEGNGPISGEGNDPIGNRHKEESKYESNKMYLANKSPAVAIYAQKERFKIQGRELENKSIPGKESFPVNHGYPGNQKFPVNDRSQGKQSFPVNDRSPGKQSFPVNDRYPGKQSFQVNNGSPGTQSFLVNDRYPGKQSFQVNNGSPGTQSFLVNDRYPGKQSFPVNNGPPGTQFFPVNDRYPGKPLHPGNGRYPAINRYPVNQSPSANQRHPVTGTYLMNVEPLKNGMKIPSKIAVRPQHPLRN